MSWLPSLCTSSLSGSVSVCRERAQGHSDRDHGGLHTVWSIHTNVVPTHCPLVVERRQCCSLLQPKHLQLLITDVYLTCMYFVMFPLCLYSETYFRPHHCLFPPVNLRRRASTWRTSSPARRGWTRTSFCSSSAWTPPAPRPWMRSSTASAHRSAAMCTSWHATNRRTRVSFVSM